jgi:hypothetical protein
MIEKPAKAGSYCWQPHIASLYFGNSPIFNVDVKGTTSTAVITANRRNDLHFTETLLSMNVY